MYRVLIIEDDPIQADVIKAHLDRHAQETGTAYGVTWYSSALELLESNLRFDLIFLDILLPGINGMEAAQLLRERDGQTPIIFVTDLAQYAVKGYEVDALDFMVKPVSYHDFKVRMDRALRMIAREEGRSIYVRTRDGMHVMPSREVVFVEVFDHDLVYHLAGGGMVSHRGKLGDLEQQLAGTSFTRISSSCLVNIAHIRSVSGTNVLMSTGETCFITRSKRKAALEAIANYFGGNL